MRLPEKGRDREEDDDQQVRRDDAERESRGDPPVGVDPA
jgi:hypothetical protein